MPGILCEHCTAACCRYVALPIETPTTRADYDDIRWYLLHERISIFVEDGDWYINFVADCRHLQPDQHCNIYNTRPRICRQYTTENCDYHSGDYGWEQHFTCPEHLDEYLRQRTSSIADKSRNKKNTRDISNIKMSKNRENSSNRSIIKNNKIRKSGAGPVLPRPGRAIAAARNDIAGKPLPPVGDVS